jgi:hypothetical protein
VQCFSSHPWETDFCPPGPFQLVAGAFNKMEMVFRPLGLGTKYIHVHVVDVDTKVPRTLAQQHNTTQHSTAQHSTAKYLLFHVRMVCAVSPPPSLSSGAGHRLACHCQC